MPGGAGGGAIAADGGRRTLQVEGSLIGQRQPAAKRTRRYNSLRAWRRRGGWEPVRDGGDVGGRRGDFSYGRVGRRVGPVAGAGVARIALYYQDQHVQRDGGGHGRIPGYRWGGAGTIFTKMPDQEHGAIVRIDNADPQRGHDPVAGRDVTSSTEWR